MEDLPKIPIGEKSLFAETKYFAKIFDLWGRFHAYTVAEVYELGIQENSLELQDLLVASCMVWPSHETSGELFRSRSLGFGE